MSVVAAPLNSSFTFDLNSVLGVHARRRKENCFEYTMSSTNANIVSSPSVIKGIHMINGLDMSKFQLLLTRVLKTLPSKDDDSFTADEKAKLQASLNLSVEDVKVLLETLRLILNQAAYNLTKPSLLLQQLSKLGMNSDMAAVFAQIWTTNAKNVVEKLSQQSVVSCQLEHVNWHLNLQMGNSRRAKLGHPLAVFEFDLKDATSAVKDNVFVEFNHNDLFAFYNQLETIQAHLDSLR